MVKRSHLKNTLPLELSINEAIQIYWDRLRYLFIVFLASVFIPLVLILLYTSGSFNLYKTSYEDLWMINIVLTIIILLNFLNQFLQKRNDTSFYTNTFTIEGSMGDVTNYNFLAIAISFKQLVDSHPEAHQEIVRIEKLKNNRFLIKVKTAKNIDGDALKKEFLEYYWLAKSQPMDYLRPLANENVFVSNLVIMLRTFLTDFTNLSNIRE